jgi:hypothetical protein
MLGVVLNKHSEENSRCRMSVHDTTEQISTNRRRNGGNLLSKLPQPFAGTRSPDPHGNRRKLMFS